MRALCWMGVNDLQFNTVPDPTIVNPHDVVLKVGLTTTCGSDLHLLGGYVPTMREGDIIGHEYMGELAEVVLGYPTGGIPGYSHAFGGYAGSHAEFIRVPFGDVNAFTVPDGVSDEQALFLSDAVPTGYMGADLADIKPGDTVAVWGCGAVGLMAQKSAMIMGAGRVIAIDRLPERLAMARDIIGSETINYEESDSVLEELREF